MTPEINCIGAVPERHADRVVAAMMRQVAEQRAELLPAMQAVYSEARDGTPKGQQKMARRIVQAGATCVDLTPGKRGRYEISIYFLLGWDPYRDEEITIETAMPEKPWLAYFLSAIESKGRGKVTETTIPVLFITHHVLSRTAQRLGLRTTDQLLGTMRAIWNGAMRLLDDKESARAWLDAPPWGHRITVPCKSGRNAIVALKRHDSRKALVAATIFLAPRETPHFKALAK
jgi:hypothetical protein